MSERPLEGKVAVLTGGGRGIGASTAAHLARAGANVVLAARTEQEVARVAAALDDLEHKGGGGLGMPVVCDVTDPDQVERLFAEADERFGPVDVLVNNAGAVTAAPLHELAPEDWDAMVAVNLTALYRCCRAALARMRPRGSGVIINVASVAGVPGVPKLPGLVGYAATKGGAVAFSEALAAEVRPDGIRVVAVSPGSVDTPMLRSVVPDVQGAMHPGDVGKVIAYLASDAAVAVTQANVVLWGL